MNDTLLDFLSFRTLISEPVLLVFYYLGALGMPLAAWLGVLYLIRRYEAARGAYEAGKQIFTAALPKRHRLLTIVLVIVAFLFMELLWRMMFEFLIAYMQIRDALVLQ